MAEQRRRCTDVGAGSAVLVRMNGGDQVRPGGSCCTSATTYTLDFGGVTSSGVPGAVLYFPVVWLETEVPMKISTRKGHVIVVFE